MMMYPPNHRWMMGDSATAMQSAAAAWSRCEDKVFEQALVMFPDGDDRWQKIAAQIPGKSPLDVIAHFEALVHDVGEIDSGRVELPSYPDDSFGGWEQGEPSQISFGNSKKQGEAERKKGTPWTEEEHRFLML